MKLAFTRPTCSQTETSSRAALDVCAKLLYRPRFIGKEACGFHDPHFQYNTRWDADTGKHLYVNVLLSSGTTGMFIRVPGVFPASVVPGAFSFSVCPAVSWRS